MSSILLWYRTDLRLHDHEPLHRACRSGATVIPVYCIDPRQFGTTSYGFPKTGSFRARFLLESLADLRDSLRSLGTDLVIRRGQPEQVIPQIAGQIQAQAVYGHREVGTEEIAVETQLEHALGDLKIPLKLFWGHTLLHPDDLPFAPHRVPEVFTRFRKTVEDQVLPRSVLMTPSRLSPWPEDLDPGQLPTLEDLGLETPRPDPRALIQFKGGEQAGKQRVQHYIWDQDRLQVYKETRNGMLHPEDASKFSPWLALGCLSPRYVYEQVQKYEQDRIQNASTYWLIFELLWRDYFRFIMVKHGRKIFRPSGLQGIPLPWKEDWQRFDRWREGTTGFPLVDANMQEIGATGFMSNRGRQNVASFLTKNLGIQWQMGAEWFESLLIDYDVCSNWGNWNYTAGVGNDARGFRYFNIPKQSRDYDPKGEYLRHWLPELAALPGDQIHEPYRLSQQEQNHFGVQIGVDYPRPVVDLHKSVRSNQRIYEQALAQQA